MRQHPRPTYGKARGQWPPQLDKGDSSAQFHGQMESARRLSLTVEFSAPLRCVWQRVSLAREIFFMQGMKNGTECTLSREMKRCPAQSRTANAIDTTPAPRKDVAAPAARPKGPAAKKAVQKHRPPVQEVSVVHLHGGTRFPHTESAPAATLSYTMQFSWLAPRGTDIPPRLQPTFSWAYPQWRTFVPAVSPLRCILALTVPVVRGLATPFLLCRRLARGGLYGRRRHWINRLFIYLSATLYYRNWPLSTLLPTPAPRPGSSLR